jgi:hypothetical protein
MTVSRLYDNTDTVLFQVIFQQYQESKVLTPFIFSVIPLVFIEFISLILRGIHFSVPSSFSSSQWFNHDPPCIHSSNLLHSSYE